MSESGTPYILFFSVGLRISHHCSRLQKSFLIAFKSPCRDSSTSFYHGCWVTLGPPIVWRVEEANICLQCGVESLDSNLRHYSDTIQNILIPRHKRYEAPIFLSEHELHFLPRFLPLLLHAICQHHYCCAGEQPCPSTYFTVDSSSPSV